MKSKSRNFCLTFLASVVVLPLLTSHDMAQAGLPGIRAAQADAANARMVSNGSGFGTTRPTVSLASNQLNVSTFTDKQIVAGLPDGLNGNYLMTVTNSSSHLFG